eukprot:3059904-Prymnesium_polylepis.2
MAAATSTETMIFTVEPPGLVRVHSSMNTYMGGKVETKETQPWPSIYQLHPDLRVHQCCMTFLCPCSIVCDAADVIGTDKAKVRCSEASLAAHDCACVRS